jgi:hypothetical protein
MEGEDRDRMMQQHQEHCLMRIAFSKTEDKRRN